MPWKTINRRRVYIGPKRRRKPYYPTCTIHLNVSKKIEPSKRDLLFEKVAVKSALNQVLVSAPLINEIYACYKLVDVFSDNIDLISKTYDAYEKSGPEGVIDILRTQVAENAISSIQTELVWCAISQFVPPPFREKSKEILSKVMDNINPAEISFCKKYLFEESKKTETYKTTQNKYISAPRNYPKSRIPDDVNIV